MPRDVRHSRLLAALYAVQAIHNIMDSFLVLLSYACTRFYPNRVNTSLDGSTRRLGRHNRSNRLRPRNNVTTRTKRYSLTNRVTRQLEHVRSLTNDSDVTCINQLRMSRDTFSRLCYLLENLGGLQTTNHLQIPEQVAIFLSILSHHKKNRVVKYDFQRSGFTISKHFNSVLVSLMRLHDILLVTPHPIDHQEGSIRWKYFTGCLGALDDTYIPVKVPQSDKPRYRNRKGFVSVNVLAACDHNMNYTYVLSRWEGSAADGRVLRDAITRYDRLKVPNGTRAESFTRTKRSRNMDTENNNLAGANDLLMTKLSTFVDRNEESLGEISRNINKIANMGDHPEPPTKRNNVYELLEGFVFPDKYSRVYVGRYLCNHPIDLDYFFSIPEDARQYLVDDILKTMT